MVCEKPCGILNLLESRILTVKDEQPNSNAPKAERPGSKSREGCDAPALTQEAEQAGSSSPTTGSSSGALARNKNE